MHKITQSDSAFFRLPSSVFRLPSFVPLDASSCGVTAGKRHHDMDEGAVDGARHALSTPEILAGVDHEGEGGA